MIGVQKRKATSGPVQKTSARGKQANGKDKSRKRTKLAPSNQGQANQLNGRPVVHANGARTMLHMDQALATRWSSASGQQQAPASNGSETESVWIFGLINNIEQLLSTFTAANSSSNSSYSSSSSPSSSSLPTSSSASCSPAGSLQSSANSTPSHHSTSSSAYGSPSSSALSSSSSSPSSSCYPPSNGPSSSATSSSSSASSGGAQQAPSTITHQPPASQLPRSPISRQIKFHEYKGPPSAKRHNTNNNNNNNINNNHQASITSKAAGEAAAVPAASMVAQAKPGNSKADGQQVKMADELTGKQQQQTNVKPNSSTHAHQTTQAQAQSRSSLSSSSSLAQSAAATAQQPSLLGPTRQCGAQSMPMGRPALSPSTPAKLNDLATLRQLHNQQEEQVHIFKQANEANPHPSGLLAGGHNQQQQHMIQQQRQTTAAIRQQQQLTQQLAAARQASLSRPVTSAPQAQPASALAGQGFYINQNTLDAPNGPTLLLAPFATPVAAKERQQQMARDELHYHQRMAMQQQQIAEVALQAQAQQSRELIHCQPETSNSRAADACSSAFMVSMAPRQQPLSRPMADYPQQQELLELPGELEAAGASTASISTQMEQQNFCDLYHQLEPSELEPSSGQEASKSHHYSLDGGPPEAAMLQQSVQADDTLATFGPDSEETEGEIEPSISFGHGVDELLFSEFIDLQDVPMNVDESDWLKKFLPPCSMS